MKTDMADRVKRATEFGQPGGGPVVPAKGAPPPAGRRTERLDKSKIDDLLARVREAARERPRLPTSPVEPPPKAPAPTGPRKVRVPITCGVTGSSFVAIAEDRGGVLRFTGHESPARNGSAGAGGAPRLLGSYVFEAAEAWACPLCGTRDNPSFGPYLVWQCNCPESGGALHCAGSRGRESYCACGQLAARDFVETKSFEVRGEQVAVARANTSSPRPGSVQRGSPAAPALPRPGPASLRLSGKG